jgi:hypothetical protein
MVFCAPGFLFWLKARECKIKLWLGFKRTAVYVFRVLESQITPHKLILRITLAKIKRKFCCKNKPVFQELIKEIKAQSIE